MCLRILGLLFLMMILSNIASAQQNTPPAPTSDTASLLRDMNVSLDKISTRLDNIAAKLDNHEDRLGKLEQSLYEFKVQGYATAGALIGIATLAGLLQVFSTNKARTRELLVEEMLNLYKVGEEASQQRASQLHNVMLREGETTLKLVNETLSLATQASKRTVEAVERKLRTQLTLLDDKSRVFFREYNGGFSNELLLRRAEIDRIEYFHDILENVKSGNNTLEIEIPLTYFAYLAQGIKQYLNQEYKSSIGSFYSVIEDENVDLELKIQTTYWIACTYNNIAQYDHTIRIIRQMEPIVQDERKFEFKRLLLESRFFNGESANSIIDDIVQLAADAEFRKIDQTLIDKMRITQGNLLYNVAREHYQKGNTQQAKSVLRELNKLIRCDYTGE